MENYVDFLREWQTLVGSALGPFLAIILTGIGALINSWVARARERAEALRRIEVDSARALNDIFFSREKLKFFVKQLRKLANDIRSLTNPKEFALATVNCPVLGGIYLDRDLPNFRIRSYYLHNKTMWMDAEIKEMNGILVSLEKDFDKVVKRNDLIVGLMKDNETRDATAQRVSYAENLEILASGIETYYAQKIPYSIKSITQLKIYNTKARKTYWRGFFEWWKYEGVSFKYFPTSEAFKNFARNLDSIDRIDLMIESEVSAAVRKAEDRGAKIFKDNQD